MPFWILVAAIIGYFINGWTGAILAVGGTFLLIWIAYLLFAVMIARKFGVFTFQCRSRVKSAKQVLEEARQEWAAKDRGE